MRRRKARIADEPTRVTDDPLFGRRGQFLDDAHLAGAEVDPPRAIIDGEESLRDLRRFTAYGVELQRHLTANRALKDVAVLQKDEVGMSNRTRNKNASDGAGPARKWQHGQSRQK